MSKKTKKKLIEFFFYCTNNLHHCIVNELTSHVHAHNDFLLSQVEHEDSSFTIVDFESSPQPKHVSDT